MAAAEVKKAVDARTGPLKTGLTGHLRTMDTTIKKKLACSMTSLAGDERAHKELTTQRDALKTWLDTFTAEHGAKPEAKVHVDAATDTLARADAWLAEWSPKLRVGAALADKKGALKQGFAQHVKQMTTLCTKKPQLTAMSVAADERMLNECRTAVTALEQWLATFTAELGELPDAAEHIAAANEVLDKLRAHYEPWQDGIALATVVGDKKGPLKQGLVAHLKTIDQLCTKKPMGTPASAAADGKLLDDCRSAKTLLAQWLEAFISAGHNASEAGVAKAAEVQASLDKIDAHMASMGSDVVLNGLKADKKILKTGYAMHTKNLTAALAKQPQCTANSAAADDKWLKEIKLSGDALAQWLELFVAEVGGEAAAEATIAEARDLVARSSECVEQWKGKLTIAGYCVERVPPLSQGYRAHVTAYRQALDKPFPGDSGAKDAAFMKTLDDKRTPLESWMTQFITKFSGEEYWDEYGKPVVDECDALFAAHDKASSPEGQEASKMRVWLQARSKTLNNTFKVAYDALVKELEKGMPTTSPADEQYSVKVTKAAKELSAYAEELEQEWSHVADSAAVLEQIRTVCERTTNMCDSAKDSVEIRRALIARDAPLTSGLDAHLKKMEETRGKLPTFDIKNAGAAAQWHALLTTQRDQALEWLETFRVQFSELSAYEEPAERVRAQVEHHDALIAEHRGAVEVLTFVTTRKDPMPNGMQYAIDAQLKLLTNVPELTTKNSGQADTWRTNIDAGHYALRVFSLTLSARWPDEALSQQYVTQLDQLAARRESVLEPLRGKIDLYLVLAARHRWLPSGNTIDYTIEQLNKQLTVLEGASGEQAAMDPTLPARMRLQRVALNKFIAYLRTRFGDDEAVSPLAEAQIDTYTAVLDRLDSVCTTVLGMGDGETTLERWSGIVAEEAREEPLADEVYPAEPLDEPAELPAPARTAECGPMPDASLLVAAPPPVEWSHNVDVPSDSDFCEFNAAQLVVKELERKQSRLPIDNVALSACWAFTAHANYAKFKEPERQRIVLALGCNLPFQLLLSHSDGSLRTSCEQSPELRALFQQRIASIQFQYVADANKLRSWDVFAYPSAARPDEAFDVIVAVPLPSYKSVPPKDFTTKLIKACHLQVAQQVIDVRAHVLPRVERELTALLGRTNAVRVEIDTASFMSDEAFLRLATDQQQKVVERLGVLARVALTSHSTTASDRVETMRGQCEQSPALRARLSRRLARVVLAFDAGDRVASKVGGENPKDLGPHTDVQIDGDGTLRYTFNMSHCGLTRSPEAAHRHHLAEKLHTALDCATTMDALDAETSFSRRYAEMTVRTEMGIDVHVNVRWSTWATHPTFAALTSVQQHASNRHMFSHIIADLLSTGSGLFSLWQAESHIRSAVRDRFRRLDVAYDPSLGEVNSKTCVVALDMARSTVIVRGPLMVPTGKEREDSMLTWPNFASQFLSLMEAVVKEQQCNASIRATAAALSATLGQQLTMAVDWPALRNTATFQCVQPLKKREGIVSIVMDKHVRGVKSELEDVFDHEFGLAEARAKLAHVQFHFCEPKGSDYSWSLDAKTKTFNVFVPFDLINCKATTSGAIGGVAANQLSRLAAAMGGTPGAAAAAPQQQMAALMAAMGSGGASGGAGAGGMNQMMAAMMGGGGGGGGGGLAGIPGMSAIPGMPGVGGAAAVAADAGDGDDEEAGNDAAVAPSSAVPRLDVAAAGGGTDGNVGTPKSPRKARVDGTDAPPAKTTTALRVRAWEIRWDLDCAVRVEQSRSMVCAETYAKKASAAVGQEVSITVDWSFLETPTFRSFDPETIVKTVRAVGDAWSKGVLLTGVQAVCTHPVGKAEMVKRISHVHLVYDPDGKPAKDGDSTIAWEAESPAGKLTVSATPATLKAAVTSRYKERIEFEFDLIVSIAKDNAMKEFSTVVAALGTAQQANVALEVELDNFIQTQEFKWQLKPPEQADVVTMLHDALPKHLFTTALCSALVHEPARAALTSRASSRVVVRVEPSADAAIDKRGEPSLGKAASDGGACLLVRLPLALVHSWSRQKIGTAADMFADWRERLCETLGVLEDVYRLDHDAARASVESEVRTTMEAADERVVIDYASFTALAEYQALPSRVKARVVTRCSTQMVQASLLGDAAITGKVGLVEFPAVRARLREQVAEYVFQLVAGVTEPEPGEAFVSWSEAERRLYIKYGLDNLAVEQESAGPFAGVLNAAEDTLKLRPLRQSEAVRVAEEKVQPARPEQLVAVRVVWDSLFALGGYDTDREYVNHIKKVASVVVTMMNENDGWTSRSFASMLEHSQATRAAWEAQCSSGLRVEITWAEAKRHYGKSRFGAWGYDLLVDGGWMAARINLTNRYFIGIGRCVQATLANGEYLSEEDAERRRRAQRMTTDEQNSRQRDMERWQRDCEDVDKHNLREQEDANRDQQRFNKEMSEQCNYSQCGSFGAPKGRTKCGSCSGKGVSNSGGKMKTCTWCKGSGSRECGHCRGTMKRYPNGPRAAKQPSLRSKPSQPTFSDMPDYYAQLGK